MSPRNVSSVSRKNRAENHMFYYRYTIELFRKQLFFARAHQGMLRPFVEGSHTPLAKQKKFLTMFMEGSRTSFEVPRMTLRFGMTAPINITFFLSMWFKSLMKNQGLL